jgi:hypothetical protein
MRRTARIRNLRRGSTASTVIAYKDSALAPEKRVQDLLARMTLEEKAAHRFLRAVSRCGRQTGDGIHVERAGRWRIRLLDEYED